MPQGGKNIGEGEESCWRPELRKKEKNKRIKDNENN